MAATPQDVQHLIDLAESEFKATTKGYLQGTPGKHWTAGLGYLSSAREEAGLLIAPTPTPPPPPPPSSGNSGLALIAYGGTLKNHGTRITDGSYNVIVGSWSDAALLSTASGKGYAYTVTTAGVDPLKSSGYVILDPLGNSGLSGALKPDAYIAKCASLKTANPKLHGIFLDNNVAYGKNLSPSVSEAELLTIFSHVSDGLKSNGLGWLSNTGWYISGDNGSNDGSIWRNWAQACEPYFDYLLFENWQQASSRTPPVRRVRGTDAWYKHWDDFQKCVAAVPGKFFGASYEWGGDLMFGTYGRASMLTAAGADPNNIFFSNVSYQASNPIGQPWTKSNPTPKVDPVAGTASL
jgi:hypothetical protein